MTVKKVFQIIFGRSAAIFALSLMSLAGVSSPLSAGSDAGEPMESVSAGAVERFEVGEGTFLLDGKPFVVKAAELHYPRIPREYWDQRIKQCKALGMNAICLYVFWNIHEERPDEFDFTGNNDLRRFVELCQENGMKVILRPGPYVCAEWEMGGLPWWLLKKKYIRLREDDPYFIERTEKFQEKVAAEVADLTIENGGPIIMVQVENEYGSYGTDKEYIRTIRDMLRKNYGDVTLFQCDWASNFLNNGLDDLVWTMNFGTGANIDLQFEKLKEVRPGSPLMCSEFWSGWFDKWGAAHETRQAEDMVAGIDEMLSKNISFSLYMTHGGTNWGHWAGANSPGFAPDVTSYDYDAPISESGQLTPKYTQLRETMARYSDTPLPEPPASVVPVAVESFKLGEVAPLFENLPEPKRDERIRNMEEYDQGFGSILYRLTLPALEHGGMLTVSDPHDYARIFLNGDYIGSLDRRLDETRLELPPCAEGSRLDILVEALGRINFGRAIKDFKGITEGVTVRPYGDDAAVEIELTDPEVYNLHDSYELYSGMEFRPLSQEERNAEGRFPAGVYRGRFNVASPSDTFLDFSTWGKGLVYLNGHPLGRIWEIGPQQTLYAPGCWLKEGENELLVFDIIGPVEALSEGRVTPLLDSLNDYKGKKETKYYPGPDLDAATPVATGRFKEGNGWQRVDFSPVEGHRISLRGLNALDGGDEGAIAEIYVLNERGERISREPWRVTYADSEALNPGNHSAAKVFDLQESTYWSTVPGTPYPHLIEIDLGGTHRISGLEYLPRMEKGVPGGIGKYEIYVSD